MSENHFRAPFYGICQPSNHLVLGGVQRFKAGQAQVEATAQKVVGLAGGNPEGSIRFQADALDVCCLRFTSEGTVVQSF